MWLDATGGKVVFVAAGHEYTMPAALWSYRRDFFCRAYRLGCTAA